MFTENKYAQFWISDGILFFIYKPHAVIDLEAAEEIVKDRLKLQNEKAYPVLCDLRLIKISEKPARDYLAQQGSVLTKAVALLIEKPYSQAMTEIFLKASKPYIPTKVFTSKVQALEFLEAYK